MEHNLVYGNKTKPDGEGAAVVAVSTLLSNAAHAQYSPAQDYGKYLPSGSLAD